MRILIVTEDLHPVTDGLVVRLSEAVKYFHKQGHQVGIITQDRGSDNFEDAPIFGVRTKFVAKNNKKFLNNPSRKIAEYIDEFSPDILHVANPIFLGMLSARFASANKIPLVVSYHSNFTDHFNNNLLKNASIEKILWKFGKKALMNATLSLATSRVLKNKLKSNGLQKVNLLKVGVDTELRNPKYFSEEMKNVLNNGQPDKKILLFVGNLNDSGPIEKILPVLKKRKDICLAIIGDGKKKKQIEQMLGGCAAVFLGKVGKKTLSEAYASADAFIFPMSGDLVGLRLLEAMASGLPVIAVKSPILEEDFVDGMSVLLFKEGDEASLNYAINCLEDNALVEKIKNNSRREAEKYTWDCASQQLLDYYHIAYTRATKYN